MKKWPAVLNHQVFKSAKQLLWEIQFCKRNIRICCILVVGFHNFIVQMKLCLYVRHSRHRDIMNQDPCLETF